MKIRLLSDLHHEFQPKNLLQNYFEYCGEDVLVLAGDIASGSSNTIDVIKEFYNSGFKNIVYVPGNHEYYGTEIRDFDAKMQLKCEGIAHFLNPGHVEINGVVFIGATLWTDFNGDTLAAHSAASMISDFRVIHGFKPNHAQMLYRAQLNYIKSIYESSAGKKKVIVTHFLPAQACISPRWRGESLLNKYFANNLDEWITELSDTTWMFGHTHDTVDIMLGDTRVVANPYGYYGRYDGPNHEFHHFKTIEV